MASRDDDEIMKELVAIASKHTRVPINEIDSASMLGEELGLVGDDAKEFFEECGKRFDLDLSDFHFSDYFPDESTAEMHYYLGTIVRRRNLIVSFFSYFDTGFWGFFAKKKSYNTVTVQDIFDSVKMGKWPLMKRVEDAS